MKESYNQLKERHQQETNALPLGFAFSNEQFNEMMQKWGLDGDSKEDLRKIVSIGYGGYVQKKDADLMHETFERHDKEKKQFRKDKKSYVEEILYQMVNVEFCINGQAIFDLASQLGMEEKEFENDEYTQECYKVAKKKYYKTCWN